MHGCPHTLAFPVATSGMQLDELFATYAALRLLGRSESNRHQYKVSVSRFAKQLGRTPLVDDLTDTNVAALMQGMLDRGRSPATCNKARDHLTALWRFASRHRMIDTWPEVKALPEPERIPIAWTVAELDTLLSHIATLEGTVGGTPAADWWTSLILVLWDTGERIGAVLKLTWGDVRLATGAVVFRAETRKGRTRDRMHYLHPDTVTAIRRLAHHPRLFHWDRSYTLIWRRFGRLLTMAGLPADRRSKFHRIRKTAASYYKLNGGNPTELLDHASPKTTKVYLDPTIVGQRPAHELLPRLTAPSARTRGADKRKRA